MTTLNRTLLLAFAVLGLGASSTSTYVHYRLLTDPGYSSFCDVNTTMSCTQAYSSQYGSFMGIPVAPLGALFFLFVLLMAGVGGRTSSTSRDTTPAYIFLASTIALAFVLYLAWASWFVLGVFCILCALTYVAVIGIFITSGAATSFSMTTLPSRAPRDLKALVSNPVPLVLGLLLVGSAVTVVASFPREASGAGAALPQLPPVSESERARIAEWWAVQPQVDVPVPANGAKVVVVKFNDYQCPACKATHDLYKPVWAKHAAGGQVRYVVKHYPLEPECNPHVPGGNHYASCEAAAAVIMARPKGTSARLEDWIFSKIGPPPLTPEQVRDAARTVAGIDDFEGQYSRALQEIRNDADLGDLLHVNATPTFFINGRRLPQAVQPQYLDVIIELELQK